MPYVGSGYKNSRDWPIKVMRGTFTRNKQIDLQCRYARRRIRLVWA